jgi:uncharacterized protein YuzE
MADIHSFRVTYDRNSDVLYIATEQRPAARGVEDRYGIVWRYDRDGELIGATIVDYHDIWFSRRSELAGELSKKFHISPSQARVVLDHASQR